MSASLLEAARASGAAELIVSEGRSVRIRVADRWQELTDDVVSAPVVWDFVREVVGYHVLEQVAEHNSVTRAWSHSEYGSGNARVFRHFDGVGIRLTFAPTRVDAAKIGVPTSVLELASGRRGLVLVAGERGINRAEALSTLIAASTADPAAHVIVLDDDPVLHSGGPALLAPRRLGSRPEERAAAMRSAVREDPDVLVIANVAEVETFDVALRAAEDGRLVIAYLDSANVMSVLARILDFYTEYDLPRVRWSLAGALKAVLVRHPFRHASGEGVVTATELLLPDEAVRDALRQGDLDSVRLMMRMGEGKCGHSLDQDLLDLVAAGAIPIEDAFRRAEEKGWMLERIKTTVTQEN